MLKKLIYCVTCIFITLFITIMLYKIFDYNNLIIDIGIALLGSIISMLFAWVYHVTWGFKYFD